MSGPNPNDVVDEDKLWEIVSDQFFGAAFEMERGN